MRNSGQAEGKLLVGVARDVNKDLSAIRKMSRRLAMDRSAEGPGRHEREQLHT